MTKKIYALHTSCPVSQIGPNTVSQSVGSHECVTKNVNIFFWRGGCDHSERVQWTERGSGSLFLPVQLHKGKNLFHFLLSPHVLLKTFFYCYSSDSYRLIYSKLVKVIPPNLVIRVPFLTLHKSNYCIVKKTLQVSQKCSLFSNQPLF